MAPYRILSLDGGGSWALLQVMALQELYGHEAHGHEVLKKFDLVAANSGGSITLGGLAANYRLCDLLDLFLDRRTRQRIFAPIPVLDQMWLVNRLLRRFLGFGAKYKTLKKLEGLEEVLGSRSAATAADGPLDVAATRMSELPALIPRADGRTDFLICGFDYDRRRARFFRSNTRSMSGSLPGRPDSAVPHSERISDPKLAEAIHASTNAPVNFFDAPAILKGAKRAGYRLWDGAIAGLNNPVLAAVTEAAANRPAGSPIGPLQILSLGTGTVQLPFAPIDEEEEEARARSRLSRMLARWRQGDQLRGNRKLMWRRSDPDIFGDLKTLAGSIVDDPPDAASFIAHVLLGQPLPPRENDPVVPVTGCLVRMSPVVRPVFDADSKTWKPVPGLSPYPEQEAKSSRRVWSDEDAFDRLRRLELDAVEDEEVQLIRRLGQLWISGAVLNQPIRASVDYTCEVGHRLFEDAKQDWWEMTQSNLADRESREATAAPS